MSKAQKIILLAAATWIAYLILFPPWTSPDAIMVFNGKLQNNAIRWGAVFWIAVIAGVAFAIAGLRRPGGRE